jgi:hypothetical protein
LCEAFVNIKYRRIVRSIKKYKKRGFSKKQLILEAILEKLEREEKKARELDEKMHANT